MDETCIECAFGEYLKASDTVGSVQPEGDEPFSDLILEETLEMFEEVFGTVDVDFVVGNVGVGECAVVESPDYGLYVMFHLIAYTSFPMDDRIPGPSALLEGHPRMLSRVAWQWNRVFVVSVQEHLQDCWS